MKRLPGTLILFFFQFQIVFAQTGKITGTVFDQHTKKPLENVNVMLFPLGVGAVTEVDGSYILIEIPEGTYRMVVSHVGYIGYSRKAMVHPGQTVHTDVYLVPKVEELEEFIVEDKRTEITPYRVDRIDFMEIRKAATGDIGTFIRETPNVSGIRKGGTNIDPVIRGFKFSQLNVQINNGIKIEGGCPNRMDPASSHIDINDVESINIYKGPYALRFGPNMGGIIRINTLQTKQYKKFKTEITAIQGFESNWNGTKSHLDIEGGNRFIYFNLSGNYNKSGNYKAGNAERVSSSFTKYNYSAQFGFNPVENHGFVISFDESFGRNVMFPALPMDERSDDTRIMSFHYQGKQLSDRINSISLSAYHSRVNHIMDNKQRPFSDTVVSISAITALNYGGRAEINYAFGKHSFYSGLDYEQINKDGDRTKSLILQPNLPVKTETLWDDARIRNIGIFTEYNTSIGAVDIVVALRGDFNDATCRSMELKGMSGQVIYSDPDVSSSFINLSISAGVIYHIRKNLKINLALGRSVRSPDMVERFIMLLPVGYDNFDYLGNPQLKPETNNQIDLSANYRPANIGNFNGSLFFSFVRNYITGKEVPPSIVMPQTKGVVGVKQFYNADHVFLYGFEFSYTSPEKYKFGALVVASITRGVNPSATRYIIQNNQVVGQEVVKNDPLPEIPPFESTVTVFYKFLKERLIPKVSVRMVATQNQTSQAYYEVKTPGFVLANLSIYFKYNKYLGISAGVNNIFNNAYYEHLNRRIIGSDLPLYEPGRVFYANLIFTI